MKSPIIQTVLSGVVLIVAFSSAVSALTPDVSEPLRDVVSAYSIVDAVVGSDFYNFFDWEAISDPTHGRV
jgi:hypothetical protein